MATNEVYKSNNQKNVKSLISYTHSIVKIKFVLKRKPKTFSTTTRKKQKQVKKVCFFGREKKKKMLTGCRELKKGQKPKNSKMAHEAERPEFLHPEDLLFQPGISSEYGGKVRRNQSRLWEILKKCTFLGFRTNPWDRC